MADSKINEDVKELFKGFSKLDRSDRLHRLQKMGALSPEDTAFLEAGSPVKLQLAEKFIENVIGYFQMPLGVVANLEIDGKSVVVPMAVEETSIVAAASKTARWVRDNGKITTEVVGSCVIGQIQIAKCLDFKRFEALFEEHSQRWVSLANRVPAHGLVKRGGGVEKIVLRKISREDGHTMAVIHVHVDACDAMGANVVNQICEFLKPEIEELSGEVVTMCILSNLVDTKVTRARIELNNIDPKLAQKIEEASLFAQVDPYRAATNNKGVLNGIDPILLATGNDWRAVEAGAHAYAARKGQYGSLTKWYRQGDQLIGEFEAPICVGVVGGITQIHPAAKMSLRMLGVENGAELSRICAAVGLVQNLGALKALTTVGIIEGHMKLHISNLTVGAGASDSETPVLQRRLEEILKLTRRISLNNAVEALKEIRAKRESSLGTAEF